MNVVLNHIIGELRKLDAKALPGPWEAEPRHIGGTEIRDGVYQEGRDYVVEKNMSWGQKICCAQHDFSYRENSCDDHNMRLIARSRTMLPALLDVIEKQHRALKIALEDTCDQYFQNVMNECEKILAVDKQGRE